MVANAAIYCINWSNKPDLSLQSSNYTTSEAPSSWSTFAGQLDKVGITLGSAISTVITNSLNRFVLMLTAVLFSCVAWQFVQIRLWMWEHNTLLYK